MSAYYSEFGFADPENAKRYVEGGPVNFVPGFAAMHRMTLQLLSETAGDNARVLVLGAGGGLELKALAEARPSWRFVAVDPSPVMLKQVQETLGADAERVDWVEGYIPDAPAGPFDAATCLLTLHFVPDDGTKLEALKTVKARLKPGGGFALVDICIDASAPDSDRRLKRYADYAIQSGVETDVIERVSEDIRTKLCAVSPVREEELLNMAGFADIDLFYAGLSWRGWIAQA